ncbi:MAG: hypothetical protein JWR80_8946 [Bradyrhizobium sp.]|nr:hypothetical protein [Bradyrhizobium sp.]
MLTKVNLDSFLKAFRTALNEDDLFADFVHLVATSGVALDPDEDVQRMAKA